MTRQYLVLDWGFIRSMSNGVQIPNEWRLLLPDIIVHEIIDLKEREKAHKYWAKLMTFIDMHRARVWGADYWTSVVKDYENDFNKRATIENVIDPIRTAALRDASIAPANKVAENIEAWRQAQFYVEYKKQQRDFVAVCDGIARHIGIETTDPGANDKFQVQWVQNPDLVADILTSPGKVRAKFRRMQAEHVTGFPDRWAIARWTRIQMWYALQRWNERTHPKPKFENNFDDAQYLFLASYAGHIATRDKGLRKAVAALFPSCAVEDLKLDVPVAR